MGNFVLYFIYHSGVLGGFSFLYGRGRNAFCLNGFAADCTFGMPGTICTGLCLRVNDPVSLGVTKSIYRLLCHQNGVTSGAMLTFGQAGFGTGRSNGLINNLGVTECVGRGGLGSDLAAYRAMLALCKAACGTGGVDSGNDLLGVRKGTNGLLRRQSLAAHRAYRALGQARLGTGCINGGEDLLSVTERAGRIRAASVVSTLLSSKILEQFAQVW